MIEIICGTNRPGSNTMKVVRTLERLYRAQGAEVGVLDLHDLPPEIFSPSSYAQKPPAFAPFQQRVLAADGLHVVTPEYNGGFPGVMKYFIDMLKFPQSFEHRCVAFTGLGAGMWGCLRGVEQLQQIFAYRNGYLLPERVFIPSVNQKLSEDGDTLASEDILGRLQDQAQRFLLFVEAHKGQAAKE